VFDQPVLRIASITAMFGAVASHHAAAMSKIAATE
jgi:hypothetical protein